MVLPPPTAHLTALGVLLSELENELPGLVGRMEQRLQDEVLRRSIVEFRGPRQTAATRAAQDEALCWLQAVSFVMDRMKPPPPVILRPSRARRPRQVLSA